MSLAWLINGRQRMERALTLNDVLDPQKTGSGPRHRRESRSPACAGHSEEPTPAARPRSRASSRRCTITVSPLVVASAVDPQLIPRGQNQQTSLGAGLLDRGAHERVDQLFQNDLARDGLRHLDHGREVEVFDRRSDRARRAGRWLLPPQVRIQLVELPHLAVGSPAQIAVAGVAQIEMRDLSRSRAPRRSARRVRRRAPRCGRSRWRAPSGWPVRRGARRRARGLRGGRSPRRPARRGSRNSPGNCSAQISSCSVMRGQRLEVLLPLVGRRESQNAASSRARRRSDIRPSRRCDATSTAAVAPSTRHRGPRA